MTEKILLVTGGSRGIGAAVAQRAAAQGYVVAVNYRSDEKAAAAVVDAIAKSGGKAVAIKGDMGVESDVVRVFETVDAKLGRLTHLVYNSGITGKNSRVEDVSTQTLRDVMDVNVLGAFWCARAAIPRMSKNKGGAGGAIVLISSVAAEMGSPGEYVWYAASKGAIDSMTVGLARELATDGIRVNAVAPGLIATEIHEPGRLDRIGPTVPMKRPGTADEIAQSVVFLLSDASSYTTGAILRVSGGR
ncbi:MAG TPA: SDR family oxidoreductase [Pseudorhodoplanes sp.]|nr:SDR family oxidoreductase [Pseudorhodoplanes sp.]